MGHAHLLEGDNRIPFLKRVAGMGDMMQIRVGIRSGCVVSSPALIHEILVEKGRKFEKSPGARILLNDLAGQGLFTSVGDLWQRQRRLLSPLFHHAELAGYVKAMNEEALAARQRMKDGARIDLSHEMMRITMGVVGRTLFGTQSVDEADRIGEALTVMLGWANQFIGSPLLGLQIAAFEQFESFKGKVPERLEPFRRRAQDALLEPVFLPKRRSPEVVRAMDVIDTYTNKMIDERRASPTQRKDLLTRLLLARDGELGGEGMSDKQVRDEANTLFVAGHETTASALSWAFYLLSKYPEARARVQAEADSFGPEGPTKYDPEKLSYTSRVFKEALRMYPPVITIVRRSREEVEIGGRVIPPHHLFFINIVGVHYRPDIYPDPNRFDPDRFLPEVEAKRPRSAWIPFSIGPRVCIGNFFALMEGAVVLATLMRGLRFDVEPRTIMPESFLTLRPKGGVWAKVHRAEA
ncbi:MAG: cytochrome P450 [Polyangiaceae bacterium]|nr:cytochrome P450 [Polyangiaceae bacterium]